LPVSSVLLRADEETWEDFDGSVGVRSVGGVGGGSVIGGIAFVGWEESKEVGLLTWRDLLG